MTDRAAPPPLDLLLARRDWVRRFARTLARDDASADDLAQDAWLAAVERTPAHAECPAGWLRRVLTRRAMDVARAERRRVSHETAAARPEASRDVADVVAAAEMHRRVVEAVVALDEPYRATVLLRYFDDLPPCEVAARMGVPVETVRARVRRAIERLRARLDAEHGGRRAVWTLPLLGGDGGGSASSSALAKGGAAMRAMWIAGGAAGLVLAVGAAWTFGLAGSGGAPARQPAAGALDEDGAAAGRPPRQRAPASGDDGGAPATDGEDSAAAGGGAGEEPTAADSPAVPRDYVVSVVDATGAPLVGVRVKLDPAEMDDEPIAATGSDGVARFRVTGPVRSARIEPEGADGRAWRPRSGGERPSADADRCTIVADAGAWVRGVVRKEDGTPFGGAEVVALTDGLRVATTQAGEHGDFALAVPLDGRFDVVLTGGSGAWWSARRVNGPRGRETHGIGYWGAVDGEARGVAASTVGVEIVSRRPQGTTTMRVRVVGDDGTPVAGVPLVVGRGAVLDDERREPPTTDAEGRATIPDVPRRRVTPAVEVGRVDARPWEAGGWAIPRQWRFVRPDDGEVKLVLPRGTAVRGRVDVPEGIVRRTYNEGRAARVEIWVQDADQRAAVAFAIADASDRFDFLVPAADAAGGLSMNAMLVDAEGVRWTATANGIRAPGDAILLRLARDEPQRPAHAATRIPPPGGFTPAPK